MARKIIPLKREKHEPKLSRAEQSQRANRTILRRTLVLMVLFGVVVFIRVCLPRAGRFSTGI